jgi:uncharacterized glyoxalase superfamily protein PhnB
MKRIDTSLIVDPSRLLPLTASVLDKLQENTEDDLSFILISMIGNSFSPSIPYAIYGLTYSGSVNTPTTLNGGYIFYNYKIYVAAAWFGGTFTTGATFVLTNANSVPSVQFTDGVFRNVNQAVLAIPTDQTLGAGDFNLNDVVYLQNATPAWFAAAFASAIANGVTVTPTLLTSFTGATVQYFKDAFGYVHLRGQLTKNQAGGGTTIFMNVAAAYRPTTQKALSVTNSDNSTLKPDIIGIATNGDCTVGNNTAGGAINTIYYLDGLSYYVGW